MSSQFNLRGNMTLTIHACRNLASCVLIGKMSPYCVLHVSSNETKFTTKIAKDAHHDPTFEKSYLFELNGQEELLHLNVKHKGWIGSDHIGRCDLSLDALDLSGKQRWYSLYKASNFRKQTGEVCMTITFDGTGLPSGSLASTSHAVRVAQNQPPAAVVMKQPPQSPQYEKPVFLAVPPSQQALLTPPRPVYVTQTTPVAPVVYRPPPQPQLLYAPFPITARTIVGYWPNGQPRYFGE